LLVPAFLLLWDWILSQPERRIGDVFPTATLTPQRVRKWSFNTIFLWLVYICYLSPLFITLADVAGIQLSAPLLGLLGIVILGMAISDRNVARPFQGRGRGAESPAPHGSSLQP
jgi:hypothetical protein